MEQKLKDAASRLPETELEAAAICGLARLEQGSGMPGFYAYGFKRMLAATACLLLVLGLGFGGYAYAAEVKEYNAAVTFFAENNLSTEGLTRAEIKAIYKDIITESFSYGKTGEIIKNSLTSEQIGGYEIWQGEPTPEDVENLWNYKSDCAWFVPFEQDLYEFHVEHICNQEGRVVDKLFYMEKYVNDVAVWRVELPFSWGDYYEVADGVIAFGDESSWDSGEKTVDSWIAKIDHDGNLLWINQLQNGFQQEYAEGVLVNADGSYTLISRGDDCYLCVTRYSSDGQQLLYKQTDIGSHGIGEMANYGTDYLLEVTTNDASAQFIRVDSEGTVLDGFTYQDGENNYVIQDMIEWAGKVYISAYAVPEQPRTGPYYSNRQEIQPILDYVFGQKIGTISNEELTPMVRDLYTAVLLVCDPAKGGKMETFYTIRGSLGADLFISDDGRLIWETESITDTFFSIATSAYTIAGNCYVYQYAFDDTGVLYSKGKTDRVTNYYR